MPPRPVTGLKATRQGDKIVVSWNPAKDNTFAMYYQVAGNGGPLAETHGLRAAVAAGGFKAVTVVAVDLYGNVSRPSKPVEAPN